MFNKVSSPFVTGRLIDAERRSPQVVERPIPTSTDMTVVRREIIVLYDRWTRADTGGFQKLVKAFIGYLEDEDLVRNIPKILPSASGSLFYTDDICGRCLKNFQKKREAVIQDLTKCLKSLETTRDAVSVYRDKLLSTFTQNSDDSKIHSTVVNYVNRMLEVMIELLNVRKTILVKLGSMLWSFQENFETLSLYLVMISETGDDFIPSKAWEVLNDPMGPRSLDDVRANNGRDLFRL
jgi:hypothetical protein